MWQYQGTGKVRVGGHVKKCEYDFFTIDSDESFENVLNIYSVHWQEYNIHVQLMDKDSNNTQLSSNVKTAMEKYNANCCIIILEEQTLGKASMREMVINRLLPAGTYAFYQFALVYPAFASSQDTALFRPDFSLAKSDVPKNDA